MVVLGLFNIIKENELMFVSPPGWCNQNSVLPTIVVSVLQLYKISISHT